MCRYLNSILVLSVLSLSAAEPEITLGDALEENANLKSSLEESTQHIKRLQLLVGVLNATRRATK